MLLFELKEILKPDQEYMIFIGNPDHYAKYYQHSRTFRFNFDPELLNEVIAKIEPNNNRLDIYLKGWK